jgi:adenine-specific DNA glycosylase
VSSLQELLHILHRSGEPMCLSELARELGKPISVLEGMLSTLVELGQLICVDQLDPCGECPLQSDCRVLPAPDRVYALASGTHRPEGSETA